MSVNDASLSKSACRDVTASLISVWGLATPTMRHWPNVLPNTKLSWATKMFHILEPKFVRGGPQILQQFLNQISPYHVASWVDSRLVSSMCEVWRVGKACPIFSLLFTKIREISGEYSEPIVFYKSVFLWSYIFAIKSRNCRKPTKIGSFKPPVSCEEGPLNSGPAFANLAHFATCGKVWLSSVRWAPTVVDEK